MLRFIILLVLLNNLNVVLSDSSSDPEESSSDAEAEAVAFSSSSTTGEGTSKATASAKASAKSSTKSSRCGVKCGKNEVYDKCPSSCPPRTCATKDIAIDCLPPLKPGHPKCPSPKCVCADNYYRNDEGECVLKEQCPTKTCGMNEVYVPCPPPTCANQTCENIGKSFSCPAFPDNYPCKGVCRCKPGYARNKIGQCITEEECKKCPGKYEYFACDNACDNECDKLSKQSHANCPIVNIKCNPMCYCLEGYARDENKNCIPISQCPPECKENEEYSKCPNKVCREKTCNDLGFPLPCLQPGNKNTRCGQPACICKAGFVRNKQGRCIPNRDCPSCGGDPNAWSGCGIFCTRCSNYRDKDRPCIALCKLNGCDCRLGFVYDATISKCVRPEKCPKKCKKNEEYSDCPNKVCRAKKCSELGFPLACDQPEHENDKCEKPACICKSGFVKNKNGECIDSTECPSCGGDPNAWPGCGTFCITCENYKDKGRGCPASCWDNGCDCRPGYVYNKRIEKCVLPKQCPDCGCKP